MRNRDTLKRWLLDYDQVPKHGLKHDIQFKLQFN